MKAIIYVLAHTPQLVEEARKRYTDPAFKVLLVPADSPWMESWIYKGYLLEHESEWKDMDFVGTVGYNSHNKQPLILNMTDILEKTSDADLVAFLFRGDPLVATAAKWHTPKFVDGWVQTWWALGFRDKESLLDDSRIASFYCNYWATSPSRMKDYCLLLKQLEGAIETTPGLRDALWEDSTYQDRGSDIAKMTKDQCLALFGKPYYIMLGFILERMPCLWFSRFSQPQPVRMALLR